MSEFKPEKDKYPGTLIIISSPSGAGKTSITKRLLDEYDNLKLSVSVTTRKKREGEIEGEDYFFIDDKKFTELVADGALLEHAKVFNNFYGTPKSFVIDQIKNGRNVIFDIDWQGARDIASYHDFHIVSIFILPPSISVLKERLEKRALDSAEIIANRMLQAKSEISHYKDYKYVIINDNINEAVTKIRKIIDYYSLRNIRPNNYDKFVLEELI
jgi:guanylate kinase